MKKLINQILMVLTLFSVVGLFSSGVVKANSPEVVRVTIDELTKVQKDSIQSGDLTTPAKEGNGYYLCMPMIKRCVRYHQCCLIQELAPPH